MYWGRVLRILQFFRSWPIIWSWRWGSSTKNESRLREWGVCLPAQMVASGDSHWIGWQRGNNTSVHSHSHATAQTLRRPRSAACSLHPSPSRTCTRRFHHSHPLLPISSHPAAPPGPLTCPQSHASVWLSSSAVLHSPSPVHTVTHQRVAEQ